MEPRSASSIVDRPRNRGDPLVEAELRRRTRAAGRITFAEFMKLALYLPGGGYYDAHAEIGRSGDFLTSPETHPVFGGLLARLLAAMWDAVGRPPSFSVVEHGAGTGALCRQVMEAAPHSDPGLARAISYRIVETSERLRGVQQTALGNLGGRISWLDRGGRRPPMPGCVIANELVDALPVHRVRKCGGDVRELYVGCVADRYLELLGPPSSAELGSRPGRIESDVNDGATIEVNLAAPRWLVRAAEDLDTGFVLIIDYGGTTAQLYRAAGPRGNLKCCYRHGWTDDPHDRPGLQDLTAPVDFTELGTAASASGMRRVLYTSQRDLMEALGLGQAVARATSGDLGIQAREVNVQAMRSLADPGGLGAYRVLLLGKGAASLSVDAVATTGLHVPLLPEVALTWPR
jgi:SAM-dependent MidA family methyltransferase